MNKYMVRGIIVLIALLGIVGVFLLIQHDRADIRQLNHETAETDKRVENTNKQQAQVPKPKPEQENPPRHVTQPTPVPKTHTEPPTYHEELLKTNPVKALRLQAEERGHWSAEHIPPFPPDDTEAQEYARSIYLMHYYRKYWR